MYIYALFSRSTGTPHTVSWYGRGQRQNTSDIQRDTIPPGC